jgi:hypothetical protein
MAAQCCLQLAVLQTCICTLHRLQVAAAATLQLLDMLDQHELEAKYGY